MFHGVVSFYNFLRLLLSSPTSVLEQKRVFVNLAVFYDLTVIFLLKNLVAITFPRIIAFLLVMKDDAKREPQVTQAGCESCVLEPSVCQSRVW